MRSRLNALTLVLVASAIAALAPGQAALAIDNPPRACRIAAIDALEKRGIAPDRIEAVRFFSVRSGGINGQVERYEAEIRVRECRKPVTVVLDPGCYVLETYSGAGRGSGC